MSEYAKVSLTIPLDDPAQGQEDMLFGTRVGHLFYQRLPSEFTRCVEVVSIKISRRDRNRPSYEYSVAVKPPANQRKFTLRAQVEWFYEPGQEMKFWLNNQQHSFGSAALNKELGEIEQIVEGLLGGVMVVLQDLLEEDRRQRDQVNGLFSAVTGGILGQQVTHTWRSALVE